MKSLKEISDLNDVLEILFGDYTKQLFNQYKSSKKVKFVKKRKEKTD